jgi:hypothetical protein
MAAAACWTGKLPPAATQKNLRACSLWTHSLICYSWVTCLQEVALVVFLRKRLPEIQYLRATISEQQRVEFGQLVEETIGQIEAGRFLPHSGIRFPQKGCLSCPYLGLCLGQPELVQARVYPQPEASDLEWLDQLEA